MVKKTTNPSPSKKMVNKGSWSVEEDQILANYISIHGYKKWQSIPAKAALNRSGKSCRLRWLNYLRPGIIRGNISEDEEDLIIRLHNLLGNRWSLIAGRLPGRTDNEIKNHWNTYLCKKSLSIIDLNLKLNQKLKASSNHLPAMASTRIQAFPVPKLELVEISKPHDNFPPNNTEISSRLGSQLLEADLNPVSNHVVNVDEFFDSPESDLPGTKTLSGEESRIREEKSQLHEFRVDEIYQKLLNSELQGSSGGHKYRPLNLDTWVNLLDYEESDDMSISFS